MGRPREFDIEQALRIATNLFWRKGYDNTSISDLTRALKITAPSFYFAFGSKEGLFKKIVENYQTRQNAIIDDALRQKTLGDFLHKFLFGFADFFTDPGHPAGCLVLNSSIPVTEDHPFTKKFADQRRELRLILEKRFREVRRKPTSLPPGSTPEAMARMVSSLLWGMAVEAQSGSTRSELRQMAEAAIQTLVA